MVQRSSLDAARVSGEGVVSVPRVSKYPSGSTSMPEAGDAEDTAPVRDHHALTETVPFEGFACHLRSCCICWPVYGASQRILNVTTRQAPQPPEWLVRGLTRELQHETGLQLFNYDLIRTTSGKTCIPIHASLDLVIPACRPNSLLSNVTAT